MRALVPPYNVCLVVVKSPRHHNNNISDTQPNSLFHLPGILPMRVLPSIDLTFTLFAPSMLSISRGSRPAPFEAVLSSFVVRPGKHLVRNELQVPVLSRQRISRYIARRE
jgi:hypothetical protein